VIAAPVVPAAPGSPVPEWAALVAEGHALLGAMSDGGWTDFNAHDPGVTMLEAFAFALTDLGYRAGHPVPDLVAGSPPAPGPDALLAGRAVTAADRRRVALAAPGVGEAWIEPAAGGGLAGVDRVAIDKSPVRDLPSAEVVRAVAAALHRQRGLGEDIDAVEVLAPMPVAVIAELEIDDPGRADAVLLAVHAALAALFTPVPLRLDAAALAARGWTGEAIHEGPAIGGPRPVDDAAPARATALQLSDAIAALAALDGVRAVRRMRIGETGTVGPLRWSLPIPRDRVPRFDPRGSTIRLVAGGGFALDSAMRDDLFATPGALARSDGDALAPGRPVPATGRDRRLADHRPLGHDLPAIYGTAPGTLPDDAPPARRAQAAQLRAYLAFLDGLLAGQFAQLAGVGALLGGGAPASYFAPAVAAAEPGALPIHPPGFDAATLQALTEPADAANGIERRNRLLAHLLARHGEEAPTGLPPLTPDEGGDGGPRANRRVLASRAAFLADIARLTAARGTGADLLRPDDEPPLLDRIRLKAGLTQDEGGRMRLVEHVLLRPAANEDPDQLLIADPPGPDPYSLQLTLVLDEALRPPGLAAGDVPLLRVARAETPAHLVLHILWLDPAAFGTFDAAYRRWRDTLAAARREALGLPAEGA